MKTASASGRRRRGSPGKLPPRTAAAYDSVALCRRPFDADSTEAGARPHPPGTADPAKCHALLDALLRPAWPDEAGRWADILIAEFGSLPAALAVGTNDRARAIGAAPARFLGKIQAAITHCLRYKATERPVIATSKQLLDYLRADAANLLTERFRALFLTSQSELMADDLIWEGTVGEAPAYPREVIKRALEVGATGIILVHNHPSGSPQPSEGDIEATRRIAEAAWSMGICVHDHIIVARTGWASLRKLGLFDAPVEQSGGPIRSSARSSPSRRETP